MDDKIFVRYEDFGAVGDGVTDDFAAMRRAHEYANEKKLPVRAESGKTYYIGNTGEDIIFVKTSTDWTGATVIFDDRFIGFDDPARRRAVIEVKPDYEPITHGEDSDLVRALNAMGGIKRTAKSFPYAPGYPAMLIPYDTTHKVYIRYGGNANSGQEQHEVILIDEKGNIDKDTPPLLDYNNVSYVLEYRVDDEPIVISGGTLITRANCAECSYSAGFSRNIKIFRSNVTVRGLTHKITDEGDRGSCYDGIITPLRMNNLLVEDCVFQAHRFYTDEKRGPDGAFLKDENGKPVFGTQMGTYELGGANSNKLYYKNCRQSNFYDMNGNPTTVWYGENWKRGVRNDGSVAGLWGVMGTNYCKNITYDGCILNRLDAHAGVYNATVKNSEIIEINLIGGGTAKIIDSTVYRRNILTLRPDYGSTWDGDIIIENVKWVTSEAEPTMIVGKWTNHNFGYQTYLPNVIISKLELAGNAKKVSIFSSFGLTAEQDVTAECIPSEGGIEAENKNQTKLSESIVVKSCSSDIEFISAPEGSFLGTMKIKRES